MPNNLTKVCALTLSDGKKMPLVLPSRYHDSYLIGGRTYGNFSASAMVEFFSQNCVDAIDLSLDKLDIYDDSDLSVYNSIAAKASTAGMLIPLCHLPFFMPDPSDASAMLRYSKEVNKGIEIASRLGIAQAVIHPVLRHGSVTTHGEWIEINKAFLAPIREFAEAKNVKLAIENMVGAPYADAKNDIPYGSRAEDIAFLADMLDTGICWDTGHANITLRNNKTLACLSSEIKTVGNRLTAVHLHDNDGVVDAHKLPMSDGCNVDWQDVAKGLRAVGFWDKRGAVCELEIKTSHLKGDVKTRKAFAEATVIAAKELASIL